MTTLRTAVQQALEALEKYRQMMFAEAGCRWGAGDAVITALRAALAQQDEPKGGGNLPPPWRCPQCNGPADNGHDRSIPPNPYLCTKCMAEMPQPSYNATVVDDAHPNGIPLEQWQNKQVKLTPWRCACGANLYIDAQGRPASKAERVEPGAVHQFRKQYCANWYDGYPDHTDGGGPYEERTLYTAPPQRKPLTEEETDKIFKHLCNTVGASYKTMTRAVEQAHGIKE